MTPEKIKRAEQMFSGVFYQRYVLGLWVRAEGVIFRQFADDPSRWVIDKLGTDDLRSIQYITFGIDFGDGTSHTIFVATGIRHGARGIIALDEYKIPSKGVSPDRIEEEFVTFVQRVMNEYPGVRLTYAFCDRPETIVNGIRNAVEKARIPLKVVMAQKEEINTRIYAQEKMLNLGLIKILSKCQMLIFSLKNQVWDETKKGADVRLDNNPDIADVADAWEYSFEAFIDEIGVRS